MPDDGVIWRLMPVLSRALSILLLSNKIQQIQTTIVGGLNVIEVIHVIFQ